MYILILRFKTTAQVTCEKLLFVSVSVRTRKDLSVYRLNSCWLLTCSTSVLAFSYMWVRVPPVDRCKGNLGICLPLVFKHSTDQILQHTCGDVRKFCADHFIVKQLTLQCTELDDSLAVSYQGGIMMSFASIDIWTTDYSLWSGQRRVCPSRAPHSVTNM